METLRAFFAPGPAEKEEARVGVTEWGGDLLFPPPQLQWEAGSGWAERRNLKIGNQPKG